MTLHPTSRHALAMLAFVTGLLGTCTALAQTMVSVRGETVNMRSGPGKDHPVIWELHQGYPLRVLRRHGRWLQVRDFENDQGWVARTLVTIQPHHVVRSNRANIRLGPGTRFRVIGQAHRAEPLKTLDKRRDWVKVERADGLTGWVSRPLLWGW